MFGMGTGGSSSLRSPRNCLRNRRKPAPSEYFDGVGKQRTECRRSKFYGQAERAISNGKLNALLRLHIRPIKQVVYLCPS